MNGPDQEGFLEGGEEELQTLKDMDSWNVVDRKDHMKVLGSTWAFKRKIYPDGTYVNSFSYHGMGVSTGRLCGSLLTCSPNRRHICINSQRILNTRQGNQAKENLVWVEEKSNSIGVL